MAGTTTPVERTATGRKILYLEAVRGAASIIVLFQHVIAAQVPAFEEWSRHTVDFGRVGVVAFFIVSGYVITLSLAHQTPKVFVVRRLYRLFPLYWLVLAAMLTLGALVPSEASTEVTPLLLMANVLMLQGLTPLASIVPTAWTLGIELAFYAQAFVAKLLRRLAQSTVLGYAWLAAYLALSVLSGTTGRDLPTTPAALLYTAAFGQALYLRDHRGDRSWLPLVAAGVVVIPSGAFLSGASDAEWPPMTYATSYLAGMALFAAFYLFRERITGRVVVWLGGISYAVYLTHPLVYRLMLLADTGTVLTVTATIVGTVLVSMALHRWVEQPFIRLGRRRTTARPVAPSASEAEQTEPVPSRRGAGD